MNDYQVPRIGFAWLLVTQAFLLLPHLLRFPVLLVPLWLIASFWRMMIYQGRWTYPSKWVKVSLVLFSIVAIVVLEKRWLNVEATVLTLLVAFLLKLIEMKNQRDVLIVVYLGYFVIVTELLFLQSIFAGLYLLCSLLLVTATLIAIQVAENEVSFFYPVKTSAKILLLSLPIMLVGFLVFPRLDPLWSVPMPAGAGKTGVSGTMSPGLFSQLAQSDQLVFRAEFDGAIPPMQEMYWRGVVLTTFDNTTWLPLREERLKNPVYEDMLITNDTTLYKYHVIMEASNSEWMFPLSGTVMTDADASFLKDFTLRHNEIIDQRQAWYFESYPDAVMSQVIYRYQLHAALKLPKDSNPLARELAAKLYQQSSSEEDFVAKIMGYFRTEPFYYTLSPPVISGRDTIDNFLFGSKQGFCEHYASAFVFLARAAEIPARVVVGYQGGDINPYERHVTVRQLDAHAWAEVWYPEKGWVRVDPTYAVSPERIERGSQESLQTQEQFLADAPFSPIRYQGFTWIRILQHRVDQVNFLWNNWVLGYEGRNQQTVLKRLLGDTSIKSLALFMLSAFVIVPFMLAIYFGYKYRPLPLSKVEKIYQRFLKKIQRKGLSKARSEGPLDFMIRASAKWPESAEMLESITQQYLLLNYARLSTEVDESYSLKQFKHDVIKFKVK